MLIPEPFCSFHKSLLDPEHFTGKFLTANRYRGMGCLNRKGYLREHKLALRLNEAISTGLQYVGIMQFERREEKEEYIDKHCIVIMDENGKIRSGTKAGFDIFEKGSKIFRYNHELRKVFKVKKIFIFI